MTTKITRPESIGSIASVPSGARGILRAIALKAISSSVVCLALIGCTNATENAQSNSSTALNCDDGLKSAMSSSMAEVLLVKNFEQGERLLLTGEGNATTPTAGIDLCMVKLLVGPGSPGPEGAPSTSEGIGIEVLLPNHEGWNERIRAYGNGGWAGTPQASLSIIASDDLHAAAAAKGFVVATSDNGHVGAGPIPPLDPSFAMNPDGSINTVLWKDFSERSPHVLAETTKALTQAYYGRPHKYAYWDGFSTGGRQGLKLAQEFPDDFDGILVGAPAINWSKYHTTGLYGQISMMQDLGYLIPPNRLAAVTQAAIEACGGSEMGFLLDPLSCRYDPTQDTANICSVPAGSSGGPGTSNSQDCLTMAEATVINKAWYGQTEDGTVPAPEADNGNDNSLSDGERLWFGWTRGTDLVASPVGGGPGIILAADQTALELQNPALGSEALRNPTGNGENAWLDNLDYAGLANAQAQGIRLQPEFSNINTDDANLTDFVAAGGKIVMYQGLADEYIPAQGAINYFERVVAEQEGSESVDKFFRFYLIPGFTHSGRSEGAPNVPVPQPASGRDEMFIALQNWVENGEMPGIVQVQSSDSSVSLPLCAYPLKITYQRSGSVTSAANYACR